MKRLRIRPHAPVNATQYGAAAHAGAALRVGRQFVRSSGETEKPPSTTPQGVGMAALGLTPQGFRALRGAVQDAKVFRAVRGAGVSLAAASGYFARCGGRPEALPLDSAIF